MATCKKCGKAFEGEGIYCTPCRWEMKWPSEILNAPELASRRKRSHNLKLVSINRDNAVAVFQSSTKGKTYATTLENCTCKDFALSHGERPCKHILRLADELKLFQSEHFESGEDDYTLDNRKYFAPYLEIDLGRKIEVIAEREDITFTRQVCRFLEHGIEQYLCENGLELLKKSEGFYELIERTC